MRDDTVFRVTNSRYHANLTSDRVSFRRPCLASSSVRGMAITVVAMATTVPTDSTGDTLTGAHIITGADSLLP